MHVQGPNCPKQYKKQKKRLRLAHSFQPLWVNDIYALQLLLRIVAFLNVEKKENIFFCSPSKLWFFITFMAFLRFFWLKWKTKDRYNEDNQTLELRNNERKMCGNVVVYMHSVSANEINTHQIQIKIKYLWMILDY